MLGADRRRGRQPSAASRERNRTVNKASYPPPSLPAQPAITERIMPMLWRSAALGAGLLAASAGLSAHADGNGVSGIQRVLLISIDGMHALDFINCSQGISGVNNGAPYCPNLVGLAQTGANYLAAAASEPSDSFPGLMALVSGGSPRTVGAFYDVAYDRSLDAPATTTGNGVAAGTCTSGAPPTGTTTKFDEGIDINQ